MQPLKPYAEMAKDELLAVQTALRESADHPLVKAVPVYLASIRNELRLVSREIDKRTNLDTVLPRPKRVRTEWKEEI